MSSGLVEPITERPSNLTEMVLASIQRAIIEKKFPPGEHVSEASLASALQVSKTPVREALIRLRHIGLVVQAERGLRIVTPSPAMIRHAYELRAGLERSTAMLASERASASDIDDIFKAARESLECARSGDVQGFRACDADFHQKIMRAARNPLLERSVSDALILTTALRERDVPASSDSIICAEEHVAISQAIADRDGADAARYMHSHIGHVMNIVLGLLEAPLTEKR